jgi:hypothetical protein
MALYHWTPETLGQSILDHLYRETIWELVEQIILDYDIKGLLETEIRIELLSDTSINIQFLDNSLESFKYLQDIKKENLEVLKQLP